MADIFNGKDVKVYYNDDTGNRAVITGGNIQINELAAYPSFSMGTEVQKIETYNDEYSNAIEGQKTVDNVTLVVNYIPTDPTHEYLDKKYDNQEEFQITIFVNENNEAGRLESVMLNGVLGSRMLNGDKDSVVTMTYDFVPTEVISYAPRDIPPVLRRGDFGVGSDGSIDYPQYQPDQATGNAFVKISASDIDNPSGVDLMGIELVDQQAENTNIMMTTTGDLRLYARNATTPWTRLYTSGEADTRYLIKSNNLSDLTNFESARSNLSVYSKSETDNKFMIGPNNLSELTNVVVARQKLEVYSQSETDAKFLQAANNLSDIVDTAIARTNLGINSTLENDAKYLQVENNLSDVKDVATARTNLGINSTIENDAKYLQVSNNLSDVSDAAAARTNISVYSKAESDATYVPKTTTVNGHALDSNVTVSKADVGLGSVTDDPQLKISANLSDLSNVAKARTNLGINSTIENDAKYLQVSNNLSDVADVDTVKQNIGLDRFKQSPSETMIYPSSGQNPYRITIRPNGDWGTWRDDTGTWEPLKIVAGGTGATNKKDARLNLNIPAAYKIIPDGTNILGWLIENNESGVFSSGENVINKPADGHGWWTYNFKIHLRNQEGKPDFGVVEATSAANIMYIIVLTNGQWPHGWFKIVRENDNVQLRDLKLTQYDTGFSGHLELYNIQNNNPKGLTQLYNEFQDGVLKTTLRTGNLENNRNSYLQWDENGSLWGVVDILSNDLYFGPHSVRKLHTRHGTLLVDGTATPYYYTFGNPDGRRSVTEFGTVEDGWIFYGQVNRDLSKQLDVNGVVNASAFNQASDRDLKENIEVISNAIDRVRAIGGYTYTLKENGMPHAGVIAQEVRDVLPEASGSFTKYVDLPGPTQDGTPLREEERFYSVDYAGITALLVQAFKEMDEKITKLEEQQKQIDELKELVQKLLDNK
ncbi:tail fiber domain-containing protein [Salmonella enterica subsp. enterica serovar 4,12:d:-]|uniref:tail fiber domain-containing protein n=1 Tax=Salmonella enterica TaxID=28901 RepID=UPI00073698D7|nr:tail fiber domain-containing protein [Salmonella enterica]EAV3182506.1 tail fiber domain-containing protein [Salmonella enterica subsp. enterica]EBF3978243.1 tail fiber domain-containing protein [Salmonella enterica subsp. enterica serovar Anatum]EBK1451803.1 tail fiber domain-containing protein [Salmonella enterica subsp. enterica serovar Schwarzengrund]ECR5756750.1 tail fiber domain-containing protein [Salmonella enterica subsp. enterica serovar 3,10:e,h:-]ECU3167279.1 tail fiber domain-c